MAVSNAMFIFEVVVINVTSFVESRYLIIRSDFADIFSLELKDPKQMHIVMPEPPPLPPEPAGKKGKKKPPPKKGKKGKVEELPPEPEIQSGQSVLFTSSPEFLIQSMRKFPLEVSLWSKEDNFTYIGAATVPWDPLFITYLEKICDSEKLEPITLKEEYNIFEEGKAKMMAKLGIQVKLSFLGDKVTTAFRTLSEDPTVKRCLYTGFNSKTTSYICNMKTTEEDFIENCNKVENNYVVDKAKPAGKIAYADYKNAPAANLTFFNEGDYCCMGHADKVPESIYKAPETCPDVNFIVDYVRKMVVSCNDNMRMLTPRPAIRPRVKATDIDRLCYCKETSWPDGKFAQMFRDDVQSNPCPVCIDAGKKKAESARGTTFDVANLRGPCGRPDCRIGRDLRAYVEKLVEEDNKEFSINDIIGPCGSKSCTLAEKIQEFIRHEGVFKEGETLEGLSTQCACVQKMQNALLKKASCVSCCSRDCDDSDSEAAHCHGKGCPFKKPDQQVYSVYYFTVEYDFEKSPSGASSPPTEHDNKSSGTSSPPKSSNYKYCSTECPTVKSSVKTACSRSTCSLAARKVDSSESKCQAPVCPTKEKFPPSPADSDVVINFSDIHNPCCVKTCDAAEKVKDFIVEGLQSKKHKTTEEDPCYCDCVCTFNFSKQKTTYCGVCGGYECLGDDMVDEPEYAKPHPCPIYHKLYDKHYIKTPNPWPEEEQVKKPQDNISLKSSRTAASRTGLSDRMSAADRRSEKKTPEKKAKVKKEKKQVGKFTAAGEEPQQQSSQPILNNVLAKYPPYPKVPKNMGWNWIAEDIPGMKPRPNWKPGAVNKILVRRYRAIREGIDTIAKKKRAMLQKKKKTDVKPTIIVKKQDGEYTVQMEVFKKYSKERLLFQYPYDDKPPLIYTIGKTEAEKVKIQKQRERRERRETRRKSRLLQSSFRDKCQEICLKAYNQAIGIRPLPNPNNPDCPCHTEATQNLSPPIDSCSCSDEGSISSSDTDGDQWEIQFSPPAAKFDPKGKHPPVPADNESQYTYLDYKVKLLDKQGNQVVRYFKGPDGRQECSDLGGFWQDRVWMEINKDGYIGPDNRWVPMSFTGPDGMVYSAEEGSFRDATGQNLKIGIDGWIDKNTKWVWYSGRPRGAKSAVTGTTVKTGKGGQGPTTVKGKGDAKGKTSPQPAPGKNKGGSRSNSPAAAAGGKGDKVKKTASHVSGKKNPLIMSVSVNYEQRNLPRMPAADGVWVDPKKMAKYKEIMTGLRQYDDFYELKTPMKSNRASNTPRKTKLGGQTLASPKERYGTQGLDAQKTSSQAYKGTSKRIKPGGVSQDRKDVRHHMQQGKETKPGLGSSSSKFEKQRHNTPEKGSQGSKVERQGSSRRRQPGEVSKVELQGASRRLQPGEVSKVVRQGASRHPQPSEVSKVVRQGASRRPQPGEVSKVVRQGANRRLQPGEVSKDPNNQRNHMQQGTKPRFPQATSKGQYGAQSYNTQKTGPQGSKEQQSVDQRKQPGEVSRDGKDKLKPTSPKGTGEMINYIPADAARKNCQTKQIRCSQLPTVCNAKITIVVEDLKSYIARQQYSIRSQFANVFNVNLKDPNDTQFAHVYPKQINKPKRKVTVRNVQTDVKKEPPGKVQTGQSVLFASNIHTLVSMMRQFPMELSLYEKDDPRNRLGSTHIAWSPAFSEYLEKITIKQNPAPAFVSGGYHVFDEYTSKRMATIRLNVKLTYLTDKISYAFRSLSEDNQKTFMYTGFNSKATTILSTIKDAPINWEEETGKIKTIYRGDRQRLRPTKIKKLISIATKPEMSKDETSGLESEPNVTESMKCVEQNRDQLLLTDPLISFDKPKDAYQINANFVKSDTKLDQSMQTHVFKSKSCSSVKRDQYKILNYIFGDNQGPFGNQVYCVNYFTVENNINKSSTSTIKDSAKDSPDSPDKSEGSSKAKYKFKVCDYKKEDGTHCNESFCSLDLPAEAADMITVTKCKQVECNNRMHKKVPEPPDERILLDLGNLHPSPCCETIEEVVGGVTAKVKYDEKQDECYCECECTFGFMKKTTYCGVCGGFETPGEDFTQKLPSVPFPCPIYHKLVDKNKLKTISTSGSDTKKDSRSLKGGKKTDKSPGSEKDSKKGKKKKDDRFKFNYGYTAPQIGHGECAMPCTGTLGAVPRSMGWLWTAEDVPALNFRPMWKPGAINKHVARLLRMAKNPGEVITKKKRKPDNKRPLKRPLIMVHKKDGEYTITMEPMKTFQKPRLVNQYPYEDKPVLTYTIGRTEAENYERQKKKEREKRRLERDQRNFIQSAFRDMCSEICMKTYQQALGILPGAEDPDCTCFPKHPGPEDANLDLSCSCSEDNDSIGSDTDSDEWIVEFTPPNATFDPTIKPKKVIKADNTSQYTYLDYRVKLFDRSGKPIVRFFKGPDGKNQCSDLGGFWSPDKKWLEINIDGYIAPDDRWAPMTFMGPGGEQIECDTGKFRTANGRWFEVGIDGYVDCHGRWKCYARPRPGGSSPKTDHKKDGGTGKKGQNKKQDKQVPAQPSVEASWSCFGDVTPVQLSKIGIVGHGHDKKILLEALQKLKAQGADVSLPKPSTVFRLPSTRKRRKMSPREIDASLAERTKCHHPVPSDKGIVGIHDSGNKAKMKPPRNRRPIERKAALIKQGISVSSFHSPCFQSFINKEMLKQQQQEEHDRGVRTAGTQVGF